MICDDEIDLSGVHWAPSLNSTAASAAIIKGSDGIIRGGLGDDDLYGGAGADLIFGNEGGDTVHAGGGDDTCSATTAM